MTNIMKKVKKTPARLLAQTLMALALVWAMSLPALAFANEGEATENGIEGTESVLPQAASTEFFVAGGITIEDDDFARELVAAQQSEKKIWVLFSSIDSDTPLGRLNLLSNWGDPENSPGITLWTFQADGVGWLWPFNVGYQVRVTDATIIDALANNNLQCQIRAEYTANGELFTLSSETIDVASHYEGYIDAIHADRYDVDFTFGAAPSAPTYTYTPKAHFPAWSGTGALAASIDAPRGDFVKLTLNGTELTQGSHYTVTEGSTIITLKESYLKSLAAGDYTLTAHFAGGQTVDLPLKIPVYLPQTGDTSLAVAGIAVLCALAGALIFSLAYTQRRKAQVATH